MNGTPVAGWKVSPKTFRWPSVYTGEPGIGLSAGIEPSARTRRTFPDRLALSWAFPGIEGVRGKPVEDDLHRGRARRGRGAQPPPDDAVHRPVRRRVEVRVVRVDVATRREVRRHRD